MTTVLSLSLLFCLSIALSLSRTQSIALSRTLSQEIAIDQNFYKVQLEVIDYSVVFKNIFSNIDPDHASWAGKKLNALTAKISLGQLDEPDSMTLVFIFLVFSGASKTGSVYKNLASLVKTVNLGHAFPMLTEKQAAQFLDVLGWKLETHRKDMDIVQGKVAVLEENVAVLEENAAKNETKFAELNAKVDDAKNKNNIKFDAMDKKVDIYFFALKAHTEHATMLVRTTFNIIFVAFFVWVAGMFTRRPRNSEPRS